MGMRPAGVRWFLILALLLTGAVPPAHAQARRLKVLATFLPVYCLTANVAGDLAEVDHLLPAGAEPHDFQFTPRDMKKLVSADVLVMNGLGIESWLDRIVESPDAPKIIVRAADGLKGELITSERYLEPGGSPTSAEPLAPNPHIWLDPQLAAHAVTNILVALQQADPARASGYERNARAYLEKLARLQSDLVEGTAPYKGRAIVTFHDAFPYFARRCGLRIVGVVEKQADVEPSPRYLSELHGVIQHEHVSVVFAETQSAPQLVEQMGKDYNVNIATLDTIETGEFTPEAYETAMRKNLRELERAWK